MLWREGRSALYAGNTGQDVIKVLPPAITPGAIYLVRFWTATWKCVHSIPGLRGGTLGAVVFFFALLFLPGQGRAAVGVSTTVTHQQNDTTNANGTSSKTQQRISFILNLNTNPTPKLALTGVLKFDVVRRKSDPGSEGTELQPNVDIRVATKAVQLNTGYRQVLKDDTVISGNTTTNLTSKSSDLVADMTVRAGKLPDFRVRYGDRSQSQEADGVVTRDTKTTDVKGSMNYKLGVVAVTGDYGIQNTTDNLTGLTTDLTQGSGQVSMTRRIGSKMNLSLRDDYRFSDTSGSAAASSKRTNNNAEARVDMTPIPRSKISANYVYRITTEATRSTDKRWYIAADYALPKFLMFYGNYTDRTADTGTGSSTNNITVTGTNFKHHAGRFDVTARYERRTDDGTSSTGGVTTETSTTRDNLDWLIAVRLASYLNVALSEAYVVSDTATSTSKTDRYRFKVQLGPVRSFELSPYVDYTTQKATGTEGSTSTELVVPARYSLDLHKKLNLSFTDNFRKRTQSSPGAQSTNSQTNNLVIRAQMPSLLKNVSLAADASFNTSSTDTASTSTASYSMRMNWANNPHSVNANIRYQTGTNRPASSSMALQYRLSLKLRKIAMALQASYTYNQTDATATAEQTSGQSVFLTLNLKK